MIDGPYVEGTVHVVLAFLLEPNRASNTTVYRNALPRPSVCVTHGVGYGPGIVLNALRV